MKKVVILVVILLLLWLCFRNCKGAATPINGYESTITAVSGNVLTLASGLQARLLGVDGSRDDVSCNAR